MKDFLPTFGIHIYQHVVKTNKNNTFTLYYSTTVGKVKLICIVHTITLKYCEAIWTMLMTFSHYLKTHSFSVALKNRCSWKFRNINRKTPVSESLLNKVTDFQSCNFIKKGLQHRYFPVNIAKFLRTSFLWNTFGGYFCISTLQIE